MQIQLINKKEACEKISVSRSVIYNWIKEGKLNEYIKKGRKTSLISLYELEKWDKHRKIDNINDLT